MTDRLSSAAPETRVGQRVGEYIVERLVARGGMSAVYFARPVSPPGAGGVALKIVHRDLPENIDADRRLEQEARAIARIDHPNVVRVYDLGWTDDGLPFLAMEYLEGVPLSQLIGHGAPMPVSRVVEIAQQMLAALGRAHDLSIIHRDLKPENVLLVERGGQRDRVKMLDFGIAKLLGAHPHSLVHTRRGVVLGTPEYMPPEIAMDSPITAATDLYAFGVILFEALTGRLPFMGRGAGELAEKHCFTPPPRLRALNAALPAELEQIVLRCLAKDPAQRYSSAAALAEALTPFAGEPSGPVTLVTARPHDALTEAPSEVEVVSAEKIEQALREELERRWTDRTLPSPLQRSVSRLDGLAERLLELQTELAVAEDRLLAAERDEAATNATVLEVLAREHDLDAQHRALQERDRSLVQALTTFDQSAAALLDALRASRGPTETLLQSLLSTGHIEATSQRVAERAEVERLEGERRRLFDELGRVAERRALTTLERTRLQSALAVTTAERGAERQRLIVQRAALRAEIDHVRRAHVHATNQFALDLAVALGAR